MVKVLCKIDIVEEMTWETETFYKESLSIPILKIISIKFEDKFFIKG